MIGPMTWLCDQAAALLAAPGAAEVGALREELTGPLRVAVVGRVSAGKSTLVNALIGRRAAPTAAGECTRVATWYRYGAPDRADLVLRDGTWHQLPFDGALPEQLPHDPGLVERIEVTLQSGFLRHVTLIDTPGLGSLGRADDEVSARAARAAGALVLLLDGVEKHADLEFVRALRDAVGDGEAPASHVIGVLSRADLFDKGPWGATDPIDEARTRASGIQADHAGLFTAVVPVAGLLAEAARTGGVTEQDARALAAMAHLPAARMQVLDALGAPEGVDPAVVRRVVHRAGAYTLNRGRAPAGGGAVELHRWLTARSGILDVEDLIGRRFVRRAYPLVADRVLRRIRQLSRTAAADPRAGEALRDLAERVELDPALHRLAELRALQGLRTRSRTGRGIGDELAALIDHDELWRCAGEGGPLPPEELRTALLARCKRAQAAIVTARDPAVADAARVLTRSYRLLADGVG
jgi:predicted GTPase